MRTFLQRLGDVIMIGLLPSHSSPPRRLTEDPAVAERLLDLVRSVPTLSGLRRNARGRDAELELDHRVVDRFG